jgi:WD40 repeat protein
MPSAPRELGGIEVRAFTAGPDQDGNGYTVLVDGQRSGDISTSGSRIITNVSAGPRIVRFDDVASNCVTDAESRAVNVVAGQLSVVEFVVTCVARNPGPLPTFGTLRITTATTGPEPDANGYRALLTNLNSSENTLFLPPNGTVSVDLVAGVRYVVVLSDIAPNCRIQTNVAPEQVAEIVRGTVVSIAFAVGCQPMYPARLPAGSQLAYVRRGEIHLVNSDGTGVVGLTEGPSDCDPSWSPDGQRLAFVRNCGTWAAASIYVMNADGSNVTLRAQAGHASSPSWSPDGKRIAFSGLNEGQLAVFTISADDDGKGPVVAVGRQGWNSHPAWSPDGSRFAFVSDWVAFDFVYDIYVTPVAGGEIVPLTNGFNFWPNLLQHYEPAWSPDGSKLAVTRCPQAYYTCDVSNVMVMNADGSGLTPVVASRGFTSPTWSPDGTVIAFSSAGLVGWVRPSTGERGFIVEDAGNPAWRPMPSTRLSRIR